MGLYELLIHILYIQPFNHILATYLAVLPSHQTALDN